MECESVSKIFAIRDKVAFAEEAYRIFTFQFAHNLVYEQWCKLLFTDAQNTLLPHQIPFLPISFFKSHKIASTNFDEAAIFESSGTLQTINSKH
ncbi:MAG: acyl transferase, partial [Chitinophagaceae bacterium]|nr:acyl transferase [Chitinophagaceae bacterium]